MTGRTQHVEGRAGTADQLDLALQAEARQERGLEHVDRPCAGEGQCEGLPFFVEQVQAGHFVLVLDGRQGMEAAGERLGDPTRQLSGGLLFPDRHLAHPLEVPHGHPLVLEVDELGHPQPGHVCEALGPARVRLEVRWHGASRRRARRRAGRRCAWPAAGAVGARAARTASGDATAARPRRRRPSWPRRPPR